MYHKRLPALLLLVCLMVSLSSAALSESGRLNEGPLTNFMLFDMLLRELVGESELEEFNDSYTFAPKYSNGFWVRPYLFGEGTFMLVKTTSSTPAGQICEIEIVSNGEETPFYRALCAYSAAALTLSAPATIHTLHADGSDLSAIVAELDLEASGYTFQTMDDRFIPYAAIETTQPYTVEGHLDIPTTESAMFPLPEDTIDIDTFLRRLDTILTYSYGLPADAIVPMVVEEGNPGEWLHAYLAMDAVAIGVVTESEGTDAPIQRLYLLDLDENPPMVAMLGLASFGAMAGADIEDMMAMSMLAGAHTSFDDFCAFLPTVAANDIMLLYGVSDDTATAYIMGTPDSQANES